MNLLYHSLPGGHKHPPVQHKVIHTLYRAGADFYLNIYNGDKQNLKILEMRTLHKIADIQQDQHHIRYKV
jgi:hypothetical protein